MRRKTKDHISWAGGLLLPAAMAAFIGLASPAAVMAGKGVTDIMEKAIKQRSAGDLDSAIRNLRKALDTAEVASQRSLAGFMLGDCLLDARQPADAAGVYQSILDGTPGDEERAEALFRLAQCRLAMSDPAGAKKLCRQITGSYPDSPYAELAKLLTKSAVISQASDAAVPEPAMAQPASEPAAKRSAPIPPKPSRPVPQYEGVDSETVTAMQAQSAPARVPASVQTAPAPVATVKKPVLKQPAVTPQTPSEPVDQAPVQSSEPLSSVIAKQPSNQPAPVKRSSEDDSQKTEEKSVANISDLLVLPPLSSEEREALATQILHDQERIKEDPTSAGSDEILMRIAEATARFGEPVEACRTYDRVLTGFPDSKHIERAYFEGVRLRAVIGLRPAVAQWGEVFLKTFPKSRRAADIRRLIEWARRAPSAASSTRFRPQTKTSAGRGIPETRENITGQVERQSGGSAGSRLFEPESDPRYRQAKRRVADNRFALAMTDFQMLTDAHPRVPLLWWELALVQIQLQQYDEAEKSLDRLLTMQPDNQDARSLLGYVHYHQKDYNQAADDYRQAGASESEGLKFFDSQTAARRMERSSRKSKPSSTREGGNE